MNPNLISDYGYILDFVFSLYVGSIVEIQFHPIARTAVGG